MGGGTTCVVTDPGPAGMASTPSAEVRAPVRRSSKCAATATTVYTDVSAKLVFWEL